MNDYESAALQTAAPAEEDAQTTFIIAGDDAEIIDDSPAWDGPFTEYNKHGRPTGHAYVRCPDCGIEVLTGDTGRAYHLPACRHADE